MRRLILVILLLFLFIPIVYAEDVGGGFFISIPSTIPKNYNIDLDNPYIITSYSMKLSSSDTGIWQIKGSNDELNFDVLDSQTYSFFAGGTHLLTINNENSYRYYQISLTNGFNNSGSTLETHLYTSSEILESGYIEVSNLGSDFIEWNWNKLNVSKVTVDNSIVQAENGYYILQNLNSNTTHKIIVNLRNGSAFLLESTTKNSSMAAILEFFWVWKLIIIAIIFIILSPFISEFLSYLAIIILLTQFVDIFVYSQNPLDAIIVFFLIIAAIAASKIKVEI